MNIYTDGACIGNGNISNIGGNGFIISDNNYYKVEVNKNTTNNREEMKGILNALKYIQSKSFVESITIYSDSMLCVNGMNCKVDNIPQKQFEKRFKKNKDLWIELHNLHKPNINYKWVKGHSGNKYNELIDTLINLEIEKSYYILY